MRRLPLAVIAPALLALAACSSGTPAASSGAPPAAVAAPSSSAACKLKDQGPDYIVRDMDPGASTLASEVGPVDLADCKTTLDDFPGTAGQGPGECTTIALASDNPGYNVDANPAPRLKHVLMSAGPGC
jgi:hypothetical protein